MNIDELVAADISSFMDQGRRRQVADRVWLSMDPWKTANKSIPTGSGRDFRYRKVDTLGSFFYAARCGGGAYHHLCSIIIRDCAVHLKLQTVFEVMRPAVGTHHCSFEFENPEFPNNLYRFLETAATNHLKAQGLKDRRLWARRVRKARNEECILDPVWCNGSTPGKRSRQTCLTQDQ
jgi:hypothetical protein